MLLTINNDIREKLGQQSPFEVYYGKKSQELVSCGKGVTSSIIQALERVNWDFKSLSETKAKTQKKAADPTERLAERAQKSFTRKYLCMA